MPEFKLPTNEETEISFTAKDGAVLFTADLIEIDLLLSRSQTDMTEEDIMEGKWLDAFRYSLEEDYGYLPTRTIAFFIAQQVAADLAQLKKSYGPIPISSGDTVSIPSEV